jgi:hypothetical protein
MCRSLRAKAPDYFAVLLIVVIAPKGPISEAAEIEIAASETFSLLCVPL